MKNIFNLLFIALLLFSYSNLKAQINLDIDMNNVKGPAKAEHYSVNTWRGNDPNTANNSAYKAKISELNTAFVRYHASDHTKCNKGKSWIDCDNDRWDAAKINDVLEEKAVSGDKIMITVFNYPEWISAPNISAYAQFCADLVHIVNIQQGHGVKYWEPFNEWDNKGYSGAEMAAHYNACYDAMKAVDPTIKLCGPVVANPYDETIGPFLANLNRPLDLYTHHQYGGGDGSNKNTIYSRADNFKDGISNARSELDAAGMNNVEILNGEWNIYWVWNAAGYQNQTTQVGACFDALSLKYTIEASGNKKLFGMCAWNDSDGSYGKMTSSYNWNPGGNVLRTFNVEGVGDAVSTVSSSASNVEGFTVKRADGSAMIAVMNRGASGTKSVQIDANGWTPSNTSNITKYVINNSGRATSTVSWSSITNNSFSIAEDNVIIFVTGTGGGGGSTPVTGVSINNCPSGSLTEGNTYDLNETVNPSNASNQNVSWSSSNTSVATVNANGVVTAVSAGSTTITVTTSDGGYTDNCTISVTGAGSGCDISGMAALPWLETFSLSNGTECDEGSTKWSATRGGGTFSVQSNQFEVNGSGGEGVWTSQQIDISGNTVDVSIDIDGAGSLDNGGQYGDYLQIYTKINGGAEMLQHDTQGGVSNQTVSINGLSGNSLEIVIRALTTASDEFYYFDNLDVQGSGGGGTIPVSGVAIDNCPSGNITEGNTYNLNETVSPSSATNKSVSWSSSNTSVATVNSNGVVSAVSAGSATITVTTTDGNFMDNCAITVTSSGGGGFSGFYYIRNRADGNNLRLSSSGATVNTSGSTDDNAQWELVNITGDEYYLENKGIGQWAYGRSDGKIKGTSSQSGNDRKWEITPNGSYYQLKNVQRNNFIGLNSSGWVRLQSTTETDTDWEIIPVGTSSRIAAGLPVSKAKDQVVSLYPNPATDLLNISLPAAIEGQVKVEAFDLTGKLVLSQQLKAGGKLQLSTEKLNKGLYMINISANGLNYKQKVMIE